MLSHLNAETVPLAFEVPLEVFQILLPLPICYSKGKGSYVECQLCDFIVI